MLPILKRRLWLLVVPFAVVTIVTLVVSRNLPNRFESKVTLVVVPQQVPEAYVKSTVSNNLADRLAVLSQRVRSRAKLERVIEEGNLYANERKTGLMEDVVERMRKDIAIELIRADAFTVAFRSDSPQSAFKVTERLAAMFRDENLLDQEATAEHTASYLDAQLKEMRTRLQEQEKRLQAYRQKSSESEFEAASLRRDHATLESVYTDLFLKREEARMAADLQSQEIGRTLRVIDPPRRPERPVSPNRQEINLIGMAAGLALGLLLLALFGRTRSEIGASVPRAAAAMTS